MRDSLDLAITRVDRVLHTHPPYRLFEPKGGCVRSWIARVLWASLHRMGCLSPFMTTEKVYRYEKTARERVTVSVERQIQAVIQRDGSSADYCILMGSVQFTEAMLEFRDDLSPYLTVPAGSVVVMRPGGYRAELSGFPVHVIPHLDGVALVPKVLVERLWDPVTGTAI